MKENTGPSRRGFLKTLTTVTAATAIGTNVFAGEKNDVFAYLKRNGGITANDQINLALIGAGGQGVSDTDVAIKVPGVKLVAVCDLYDGRLADAKKTLGRGYFYYQKL